MKNYKAKLSVVMTVCVFFGLVLLSPAFSAPQEKQKPISKKSNPTRIWNGDYEVNSIEDIAALRGYTKIKGELTINSDSGVSSLADLGSLYQVEGGLTIWSSETLTSLNGLNNLRFVDGQLSVYCSYLTNLDGLNNLKSVGNLYIAGGHSQTSEELIILQGLDNLEIIREDMTLYECNSLESVEGLGKLRIIGGGLYIEEFYLENLKGLQNLESIGFIDIHTATLKSFEGLEKIEHIKSIRVWESYVDNFKGLENLKYVSGYFSIFGYDLKSVEGLGNLIYVGGGLEILGGTTVCLSDVEALRDQIISGDGINDEIEIEGNPDC